MIELLAAVAIISMLAAILFPVYASSKEAARSSTCQSNLRQIGAAFSNYLADWSNVYPDVNDPYLWMGRRWRWPLKRHLALTANRDPGDPNKSTGNTGGVLYCPNDPQARQIWDATSYGYSAAFYHAPADINSMTTAQLWNPATPGPPCAPQSASDVARPSRKALVADWLSNHSQDKVNWWSWLGSRNYLFADGHVKCLPAKSIRPAVSGLPDINLTRQGIQGSDL